MHVDFFFTGLEKVLSIQCLKAVDTVLVIIQNSYKHNNLLGNTQWELLIV